jgi:glycosyltransferase involved in cell wall biosynthesis
VLEGRRVGLDARQGPLAGVAGVATYRRGLMQALSAAGARLTFVSDAPSPAAPALSRGLQALRPGVRRLDGHQPDDGRRVIGRRDLFREAQTHFNIWGRVLEIAANDPPDIMHWSYPLPLRLRGCRNVYTVHDLIPLEHPGLTTIRAARHGRLLDAIAAKAHGIITVSEHSRRSLHQALPGWSGAIVNTYQSLPGEPALEERLPPELSPDGYMLFCGGDDIRKNFVRTAEAYRLSGVQAPLVVVGTTGSARPTRSDGILWLGWTTRALFMSLLRHARALLFPSLAEGFGLPVLEAFSAGTPVLTSNEGALAEIAGNAALLGAPEDVAVLSQAIRRLWTDPELRHTLAEKGFVRAQTFTAARHATRLVDAYRQAGADF